VNDTERLSRDPAMRAVVDCFIQFGNLQTLCWLIIGLVNARTVNLSHLVSQRSSSAQVSSSYRRLQRFFQYITLEGDWLALGQSKAEWNASSGPI
jgi:hypothetical protein